MNKESTRHFLTKTLILLIMVLVALPCTLKREVKQGLNIPLVTWEESDRSTKNVLCQSATSTNVRKSVVSFKIKDTSAIHSQLAFIQVSELKESLAIVQEITVYRTVPLHILHEQYLI